MAKSKSTNGKVTIANVLAMVGLAGIGVISFFGMYLHSKGGAPGVAVICSVALVAGLAFLLVMAIKAKSAEDNQDKWVYVEWGCVAAYVIVALVCAGPFQRFIYVMSEKAALQEMAEEEIKAIDELYRQYDYQQDKFLTEAKEQFENYKLSAQPAHVDMELYKYVNEVVGADIDGWKKKAADIVKLPADQELSDIKSKVEVWNVMQITSLAAQLENKESSTWNSVETKIRTFGENNRLIPVIRGGGTVPYEFAGYASFDLGEQPEPAFARKLRSVEGHTVLGWALFVILNLLVLLNYVATLRSGFVGPRNNRETGGMSL